jgi:hypothetical protein
MAQKLSDTQLVILSAACQRDDRSVYPITAKVSGGALSKVLNSLLGKGMVEEIATTDPTSVWRTGEDGARFSLRATTEACRAIGIEAEGAEAASAPAGTSANTPTGADTGPIAGNEADAAAPAGKGGRRRRKTATGAARGKTEGKANSKQAQLVAMLRRPEGASLDEIMTATGWQAHTVRGAIAGALKKKLGLTVTSEKLEGRGRVYRIDG